MNKQDINNLFYKNAIEREIEERKNPQKTADYMLADKLRQELFDCLGVESYYFTDLCYRTIIDDKCVPILCKYIPLFNHKGFSEELITQQFWRKGNKDCSAFLKNWYYELVQKDAFDEKSTLENTLDNALIKIQDKNEIPFLLELIKEKNRFPFTMAMLGRWKVEEAKPIIIRRLETDKSKTQAIRALGYYKDKSTIPLIEKYINDDKIGVRKEAKNVINRLKKL